VPPASVDTCAALCLSDQRTAPQISDAHEDVIVLKLLEQFDLADYEIVKQPDNAGFTFETPGGDGSI